MSEDAPEIVVGIVEPPTRIRTFPVNTQGLDAAEEFVGTLEGALDGRYYIDSPPRDELDEVDPQYYLHDLNEMNLDGLAMEVENLRRHKGRLVAICDEDAGIIAYALTDGPKTGWSGFAVTILDKLNRTE